MDKSGQRHSSEEIIDVSASLPWYRRLIEALITFSLWGAWGYFIMPVITLALWALGIKWFGESISGVDFKDELLQIFNGGVVVFFSILILNALWILHNWNIFRKLGERRSHLPNCTTEQMAEFYRLPVEKVRQCRDYSRSGISVKDGKVVLEWSCNTCTEKDIALKNRANNTCDKDICFYELDKNGH